MTDPQAQLRPPPPWRIWSNPIFRRYARSRLRLKALLPWVLLTVIFSGFAFTVTPVISRRFDEMKQSQSQRHRHFLQEDLRRNPSAKKFVEAQLNELNDFLQRPPATPESHERKTLLPLLAIQALILFVIGTGQVAGGMTTERDEGMEDYLRLAPMTPMAKTLGYLAGLPVREWVMFLSTLPFTAMVLWRGAVPFSDWGPVALIFLTSVILYHLTGLVTGSVLKNRRWAFLLCMAMVFLLYFLVPQGSRFGLPFLRYMTMWPTLLESSHFLPPEAAKEFQAFAAHTRGQGVKFFKDDLVFSDVQFTLLVQGSFIITMLVMVWRRWRQADSHLLSKAWAMLVFGWLCILPLGNAIPSIKDGSIFPARAFRKALQNGNDAPTLAEALVISGFYGTLMLLLLIVQVFLLTPSRDMQARGLRRAAKLGRGGAPFFADASSAFATLLILLVCAAASWGWFTRSVLGSEYFSIIMPWWVFGLFFGMLAPSILGLHILLETRGGKWPFLAIVFLGLVPLLMAIVIGVSSHEVPTLATVIAGASPLVQPFYATEQIVPGLIKGNTAGAMHDSVQTALYIWPVLYSAGLLVGMIQLRAHWKRMRAPVTS